MNRPTVPDGFTAEPIAVVGMGCRFPGDSDTPDDFWQMLVDERSGFSLPPPTRWEFSGFQSDKARPGTIRPEGGYFIGDDVWNFDPSFFGIVQAEASAMDPQQRKLLECIYEAFESGGITLSQVSGSNTGCYVGNFTSDYWLQGLRDIDNPKPYSMTGGGDTILSNRVSYLFDLRGPSFTLDSACSSSLYAVHIACRSLATREIDAAVVGGTNLMLSPEVQMSTDKLGVLSPTSACHTFDESADGYGRAEGIGALYLKRLSDAIRDKDPIRGIIRGSAANANGKTSGITQPSARGQEAVIRAAYSFAGLDPKDTSYFETHGTGTQAGDPTEAKAIGEVFLEDSTRDSLLIGAVKTNIGHSEAASAMASIIKTILALEKKVIPATIGVKKLNPKIDFKDGRLQVVKELTPWPEGFSVRRASLNSFGYGGANSHIIIDAADSYLPGFTSFARRGQITQRQLQASERSVDTIGTNGTSAPAMPRTEFLLPFSAHDLTTLKKNIEQCREVAEEYDISDLAYTLGCRRSKFFNCAYAVVREDEIDDDLMEHEITFGKRGTDTKLAFIFTGQGAQSAQMGRDLMLTFPSYIDTIRRLDHTLQSLDEDAPEWSLEDVLMEPASSSKINDVEISQPVCTAVQIAIVELLKKWNVTPEACIGHSSGEIASSYAAGAITAEEAIISAYYRGMAVGELDVRGTMLAVGTGPDEIKPYLVEGIRIACYNSPNSVTLSGDAKAAAVVKETLDAEGIFVRELKTGGRAYHSHHMKNIGGEYEKRLSNAISGLGIGTKGVKDAKGQSPIFFSSVTGQRKPAGFKPGPSYWRTNLESPVRFAEAVAAAVKTSDLGIKHCVEIGPHSALAGPLRQIRDSLGISPKDLDYSPTLVRGQSSVTSLLDLAGTLTIKAYPIDLARVNAIEKRENGVVVTESGLPIVDLPRYSWNYTNGTVRNVNRPNEEYRLRKFPFHALLGSQYPGTSIKQRQWRNMLDTKNYPWLEDHKLGSQPVFPATGYLAVATEAARQFLHYKVKINGPFRYYFPHVSILSALSLPPAGEQIEIVTTMRFATISASITSKSLATVTISSYQNGIWTEHCVGTVLKKDACDMVPKFNSNTLQEPIASHTWYRGFKKVSLNYGPAFQGLSGIRADPAVQQVVANTALLPVDVSPDESTFIVHPAAMDTCIQVALMAAHRGSLKELKRSFVPASMEGVSLWSWEGDNIPKLTAERGMVLTSANFHSLRAMEGWFQLYSPSGKPLLEIENVSCTQYTESLDDLGTEDRHPYLRTIWKPDIEKLLTISEGGTLLDLLVHKYPGMDILETASKGLETSDLLHQILESGSSLRRYMTLTRIADSDGNIELLNAKYANTSRVTVKRADFLESEESAGKLFDLIIVPQKPAGDAENIISNLKTFLKPDGQLLLFAVPSNPLSATLEAQGLAVVQKDQSSLLIRPVKSNSTKGPSDIVLITRGVPTLFDSGVMSALSASGKNVKPVSLTDHTIDIDDNTICVSIVESGSSLFHESLAEIELTSLQSIAAHTRSMLWVTHGNLLEGGDPNAAIVMGLGRCLQSEHPTLTFRTVDLDHRDPEIAAHQILTLVNSVDDTKPADDKEFIVKNDVFYVSRLSQDVSLDRKYVASLGDAPTNKAYDPNQCVRLRIERVGLLESLYFEEDEWTVPLKPGEAEVEVKASGLNMKDFATLSGTYNSDMLNVEGSGIVRKIGKGVTNIKVGDRVAWVGFSLFKNIERYDARFLQKIGPDDTFEEMASFMMPMVTAIYALIHLAKLQKGETVLIHSATGGVGLGAIQIAQLIGAEIFATVGTPAKKEFLKATYGLDDAHILTSRDQGFVPGIMEATNGRGVDVSLNSLVRENLKATWNCIATHGRHIELGQTDILDQGVLDMAPFKRSASFIALDLVLVATQKPDLMAQILGEVMQYRREKKIKPVPNLTTYPASEISNAFENFGKPDRIGKVVVSYEKTSNIKLATKKKSATFKSEGAYLLVGCLGGLGRCLARHMVDNGARHLIFLGRSGEDRPEAAAMIKRLRSRGVTVDVIKGDVTCLKDVKRAVKAGGDNIIGVVQGVMSLDDRLFTRHDLSSWEYAVRPKVTGTWNLHNSLAGQPLDFFVMLGSTSAMTGSPTQSNYCAGNTFLEYFARYRNSLGLPATTVCLTMVLEIGFVSQNEVIEQGLARSGIQPINEARFIQLMETAIGDTTPTEGWKFDPHANHFLVSGLEPATLSADIDINDLPFWRQARVGPLLNAIMDKITGENEGSGNWKGAGKLEFPDILELVIEKFSKTFNLDVEDINSTAPLVSFGMDSMIGTSLRTWCYKQLGADIAASDFMSTTLTAEILAKKILEIRKAGKGGN